jgi:D-amino-acid dehydrogenase
MKVCVLGGGVVGLTSAWFLARDGHEVTLLERNPGVGLETSYANGGQLSYSYVAPLAGPGVIPKVPPWLLKRDSPLRFYPKLDPHQWRWCLDFLAACSAARSQRSTAELLPLSFLSRDLMRALVAQHRLEFDYATNGKLVVFRDAASWNGALALMSYQESLGCQQQALDPAACVALEPALERLAPRLAGGVYTPSEDVGDCFDFCQALKRLLQAGPAPVTFRLGEPLKRLRAERGRVVAAETARGAIEADAFVVALGLASRAALLPLGIRLPIYPLKGYSITLPIRAGDRAPAVSITDAHYKIVFARLGNELRVAGMVDLAGYDKRIDPVRVDALVRQTRETFPDCGDFSRAKPWCGLRPATPQSKPILGASPYRNLWLNVGHGALGFTLACSSAKVVADIIAEKPPSIPVDGFRLSA